MFVEPEVAEVKATTTKADPTAPARSSIRRQRTVRYSPNVRDHQTTLNTMLARNQHRSQGRMRMLADRRSLLEDIRRRDQGAPTSTSGPRDTQDVAAQADVAHLEATQRNRMESGRALLRDALSYERPSQRMRVIRESDLPETRGIQPRNPATNQGQSEEAASSSRFESRESQPPNYMPTPPYTSNEARESRSPQWTETPRVTTPSLTPRFAPAHRLDQEDNLRPSRTREEILARLAARMSEISDPGLREDIAGYRAEIDRMLSRDPTELTLEYREAETAYLESVESSLHGMSTTRERALSEFPALRRMDRAGHDTNRATHEHPENRVDGLGDRERSFSPDDDQWETMLTTIQPDQRVPSAASSFSSASASSSSLSSNAVSSHGTQLTAPSTSTEIDAEVEIEACPADLDDSDSDPDDELGAQLNQASRQAQRLRRLAERMSNPQYREEYLARRRRMLDREEELDRLETSLRRLERQLDEERTPAAGRRRDSARTGRERL